MEGYVLTQAMPGTIALKTYHNARLDDYVSVANPETEQQVRKDGYVFIRVEGYIFASAQPGTIPLQQYWNPERTDYQAASSADGIRDADTWGYRFVRTEGFLLPSEQTPVPLAGGQPGAVGMTDHPIPGPSRPPDGKIDSPAGLVPAGPVGLRGEYFDNRDLRGPAKFMRLDPSINFDWGGGSPGAGLPGDNFGVRWTGQILPDFSESYVFAGNRDNGFRLWIDGQLIVDLWNNEWGAYESRPITLQGKRRYDIKIEYYEDWGGAALSLKWRSRSQPEEIVPAWVSVPAGRQHWRHQRRSGPT